MSDRKTRVWLDEQRILRIEYPEDGRIGLTDIQSAFEQYLAIPDVPRKVAVLFVNSSGLTTSLEAEDYGLKQGIADITLARAALVSAPAIAAAANHYFTLRPLPYPTKAFVHEESAVAWLKTFQNEHYGVTGAAIAPQFQSRAAHSWGLCPLS
jgi:hypothetical protein